MVLADLETSDRVLFPSIERLSVFTGMDRKTVITARQRLVDIGILRMSGEKRGRSGRIDVYQLVREWGGASYDRWGNLIPGKRGNPGDGAERKSPASGPANGPENGTKNNTGSGTTRQSRIRYTEPSNMNQEYEEEPPLPPKGGSEGGDLFGQSLAPIAIPDQAFGDLYVDMWNQLANRVPALKEAKPLRDENLKALMARLRENKVGKSVDAARDFLASQLAQFEGSRLLRGEGDRGWVPAATWLLGKKNFGKVIDGFYVQDAAAGGNRPKRRDERSYADTAERVGEILRARGPAPRQTARQLAGLPARGSAGDHR